jgi:hypothetical protein
LRFGLRILLGRPDVSLSCKTIEIPARLNIRSPLRVNAR